MNDKPSDTPRTDGEAEHASNIDLWMSTGKHGFGEKDAMVVPVEFARTLEREIAELKRDKERLDWLNENMNGSFGPARASDDEHPIHTHSFDAPVYEHEQGGVRAIIDAAIDEAKCTA